MEIGGTDPVKIEHICGRSKTLENPTRISARCPRKLKITIFGDVFFGMKSVRQLQKRVVPDQGENWCRQSLRPKVTIDISSTAQFVTDQRGTTKKTILIH